MTTATQAGVPRPTGPEIGSDIAGAGVDVPCLPGYVARTFRSVAEIPRETANAFMLEYIATQAEIYERVNGEPVDGAAHIAGFWASMERVLPPQGSYYLVWSEQGGLPCVSGAQPAKALPQAGHSSFRKKCRAAATCGMRFTAAPS